jgi:hypothetical protein
LDNFVEELKGGIAVEPEFVVAEEPFIEEVIEVIPEPAIVEDGMIDEESLSPSLKTPKKSYH